MEPLKIVELVSTIAIMIGVPLISIPRIEGLYIMILGQIGWTLFGYFSQQQFFLIQSVFLLCFNFVGIYNWRRKRIGINRTK